MAGENNQSSALDLSDEEFIKQGAALMSAANAADAAGSTTQDDASGTNTGEDLEAKAQAEAEAAAAASQNQDDGSGQGTEQGAGATAQGEGDAGQGADEKGKTNDVTNIDDAGNDGSDAEGKKRGPDGKFVKSDDAAAGAKTDDHGAVGKPKVVDDKNTQQAAAVDKSAEYDRLLAPFKANGRDIKVENVDEAIRLMQMGANYNRKMAALKPNLAIMKTLENNGLLDPVKINFLIDLEKKNPEAISKLIKESGIDPLDISVEKADGYKPGNHSANENQVELDNVLDDIQHSPKYAETLDLVSKDWDAKSRTLIAAQPQLLKVINGHMENGVFDLVVAELERKKLFGGLLGLSDLEAYRQVGDEMASSGKFEHLKMQAGQPGQQGQQASAAKVVIHPKPKQADDSKREEQRRAAAPARGAAPAGKLPADFNPLSLSDDEFAKFKPNFA